MLLKLFEPTIHLTSLSERHKVRALIIFTFLCFISSIALQIFFYHKPTTTQGTRVVGFYADIILFLCFLITKSRFYFFGSMILSLVLFVITALFPIVNPRLDVIQGTIPFFILPFLISTLLQTWFEILLNFIVLIFLTLFIPQTFIHEENPVVQSLVAFNIMISVIFLVSVFLRARNEKELKKERLNIISISHLATVGHVAGNIAHEINNPLSIIRGYGYMLKNECLKYPINQKIITDIVEKIDKVIDRVVDITNSVLKLSKSDNLAVLGSESLSSIISMATTLINPRLQQSKISLNVNGLTEKMFVTCNSIGISQVLINLMSNAIGSMKNQSDPWICIEIEEKETQYMIKVINSGKEMPTQAFYTFKKYFFKTEPVSFQTRFGYSICQAILKQHNSELVIIDEAKVQPMVYFLLEKSKYPIDIL